MSRRQEILVERECVDFPLSNYEWFDREIELIDWLEPKHLTKYVDQHFKRFADLFKQYSSIQHRRMMIKRVLEGMRHVHANLIEGCPYEQTLDYDYAAGNIEFPEKDNKVARERGGKVESYVIAVKDMDEAKALRRLGELTKLPEQTCAKLIIHYQEQRKKDGPATN
jgi:hypothetical protein